MAVRLRLKIQPIVGTPAPASSIEAVATVNSGYEADAPEIIVPVRLAERLGLWPSLPEGACVQTYATAGGPARLYRVLQGASVGIQVPDRNLPVETADVVINPVIRQVLVSDTLGERLGIVVLKLRAGVWRLADEPSVERPSEIKQLW
ncbi:MAG: hypothetical protein HY744_04730 [Deltaproteobacteria bacterium]|nr:hypothetical protein [Deltaproteobacteria bacterium]